MLLGCILLGFIVPGLCLECYTCVRQDNNKDKCIKTTIQCEEYENGCYSQIRWGIPPYWRPHGDRIYFLDKGCMRFEKCLEWQKSKRNTCRRDWYLDWECVECCRGDMCNYYVTLGASLSRISIITMLGSLFILVLVR